MKTSELLKREISNGWVLTYWDANSATGAMCYRKKFGKGHVSVGCGDSLTISYSFGANSDLSYSCTRWRKDGTITEQEAMDNVDKQQWKAA